MGVQRQEKPKRRGGSFRRYQTQIRIAADQNPEHVRDFLQRVRDAARETGVRLDESSASQFADTQAQASQAIRYTMDTLPSATSAVGAILETVMRDAAMRAIEPASAEPKNFPRTSDKRAIQVSDPGQRAIDLF